MFDWKNPNYEPVYLARLQRLEAIRSEEGMLSGLVEYYEKNPADFIEDWGMTFDPRNVERGIDSVTPFLLFPKQRDFVNWVVERWENRQDGGLEKSRDMGASWLCVGVAVWMWLFKPGVVIGFGSRKEEYVDKLGDPKSLFWKVREFIRLLPTEFLPSGYDPDKHAPHMRIINPYNGSSIVGEAGENIGRGNRTSIYFIDEAAFLEKPVQVDAALSQTSNCRIYVSTPNGVGNPFYQKRMSGRIPFFVMDWRDDPRKDEAWYQSQLEKLDPIIVAQEIDRNYSASVDNSFISTEDIRQAMARGPADVHPEGPVMVGVDVARFGGDKSVITFRQGRLVYPQIVFGQADIVQVASRVQEEIKRMGVNPGQIAVDSIGVGAGVADVLRREFRQGVVVDVNSGIRLADGQHYNLRAKMWAQMRDFIKGPCSIPRDNELEAELGALRYEYRGGELLIESKESAKKRGVKSPDRADSLALTFAIPARWDGSGALKLGFQPKAETDYDIFG